MNLRLKYFGMVAEKLGKNSEPLELQVSTVGELTAQYDESLAGMTYKVAVNHQLVDMDHKLNENDEVAFLPPFAGG